ncbi:MAG: FMN-binding protein [Actinobacteria bacterium]|nr:FMN-binding protein [Actinomycetota bacterium]
MTPATHTATPQAHRKVITVTKTVQGDPGSAGQWGEIDVTLVVKKTTTIVGKKKTVKRAITSLDVPVFPNHTDRSIFINQQALPLLESETLAANYSLNGIQMISGATYTSQGFLQSLQSALLKAQKI